VEFLVRFEVHLPRDLDRNELDVLMAEERERGDALWASGKLKRLWRVPGRRAGIGLYEFVDADELHQTFASFPLFPYMDVVAVEPLAPHPGETDYRARTGA
jgi:muconolactone D-isomerase